MDNAPDDLVLLHGFGQNSRCWGPLLGLLGRHPLTAIDLPGHGTASEIPADLWQSGSYVTGYGGVGTYVGYSLGARIALHAALGHPEAVRRLVLISGTAGIDDADERAARRASDEALAERIESIGVRRFVDEWLSLPMFRGLDDTTRFAAERETNTEAGLMSSLRLAGAGTQEPLWLRLGELAMPVLVIAGAHDTKFVTLAERMAAAIGDNAALAIIAGAGHSAHLEEPSATAAALNAWLTQR